MKRTDFRNITLGLGITTLLLAGLILLPGVVLASTNFQAAGTATVTAAATGVPATGGTRTYVVQKTDTLSSIAIAHGVTVMSILEANPSIANPNLIVVGQTLTIPAPNLKAGESIWVGYDFTKYPSVAAFLGLPSTGLTGTATPGVTATPGIPATGPTTYVVKPDDTLSSIAVAFHVTVNSLLAANPSIGNPNILFAGQTINIPAPNLKAGESVWVGYDFTKYPSFAAAHGVPSTGATGTPSATATTAPTATLMPTATTAPTMAPTATATTAPAMTTPTATTAPMATPSATTSP